MKRTFVVTGVFVAMFGLLAAGCAGVEKASSSAEAIEQSQAMQTVDQKVNYLVGQAKAFYNSQDFQETVAIAQHILLYLDKDSQAAKDILDDAKAKLAEQAGTMVDAAKKKLGNLGQ